MGKKIELSEQLKSSSFTLYSVEDGWVKYIENRVGLIVGVPITSMGNFPQSVSYSRIEDYVGFFDAEVPEFDDFMFDIDEGTNVSSSMANKTDKLLEYVMNADLGSSVHIGFSYTDGKPSSNFASDGMESDEALEDLITSYLQAGSINDFFAKSLLFGTTLLQDILELNDQIDQDSECFEVFNFLSQCIDAGLKSGGVTLESLSEGNQTFFLRMKNYLARR